MSPRTDTSPIRSRIERFALTVLTRLAMIGLAVMPLAAQAEPFKLKLSFFTSDRSYIYQNQAKPFVDAVNDEGRGLIEIDVDFSSAVTKAQDQMSQLVANGTADIAIIVPGLTPDRFGDTGVMELPGIFRDSREASLVFTRLLQAAA